MDVHLIRIKGNINIASYDLLYFTVSPFVFAAGKRDFIIKNLNIPIAHRTGLELCVS